MAKNITYFRDGVRSRTTHIVCLLHWFIDSSCSPTDVLTVDTVCRRSWSEFLAQWRCSWRRRAPPCRRPCLATCWWRGTVCHIITTARRHCTSSTTVPLPPPARLLLSTPSTRPQSAIVVLYSIVTDRISEGGNAIASIRPSVCPFVSTLSSEPTDRWPWTSAYE